MSDAPSSTVGLTHYARKNWDSPMEASQRASGEAKMARPVESALESSRTLKRLKVLLVAIMSLRLGLAAEAQAHVPPQAGQAPATSLAHLLVPVARSDPNPTIKMTIATAAAAAAATTTTTTTKTTPPPTTASTASPEAAATTTTMAVTVTGRSRATSGLECPTGLLTFELATGFIYKPTGAFETLSMMPSTLQLTDCLEHCLANSSCLAINFEMGLCVLLAASAQQNPHNLYSSQFPVFTIYAEKKCLLTAAFGSPPELGLPSRVRKRCKRAWTFERVAGFEMKVRPRRRLRLASRELCMEACLAELEFECRSANWYRHTNECALSHLDRHSVSQSEAGDQAIVASLVDFYGPSTPLGGPQVVEERDRSATSASNQQLPMRQQTPNYRFARHTTSVNSVKRRPSSLSLTPPTQRNGMNEREVNEEHLLMMGHQHQYVDLPVDTRADYLENNCVYEPNKLCEFRKIQNRVLKTVDSIYQEVSSLEECKQKCLMAPYRCYSFDYGDTSERVCRTSHLDQASLLSVREPYLEVAGAITYELASCFNVSVACRAHEMVVQVSASKSFQGRIYAKTRPSRCLTDVQGALQFELPMRYHDDACDVRASSNALKGVFSNELVIQHHDRIMTTQDVGLSAYCEYDLANRSVSNNIDLAIESFEPETSGGAGFESKQQHSTGTGTMALAGGGAHQQAGPLTITGLATTIVHSPNVTMRITNMNGQPVTSARVGDRLALLFEVKEKTSPFGIAVREIVAMDGRQYLQHHPRSHYHHDHHHHRQHLNQNQNHQTHQLGQNVRHQSSEQISDSLSGKTRASMLGDPISDATLRNATSAQSLYPRQSATPTSLSAHANDSLVESMFQIDSVNAIKFLDSDGCPTDANLMGPLIKMDPLGHRLLAPFDAFKFPTSDIVFFRAVVTSCLAECKPTVCPNLLSATGAGGSHNETPARPHSFYSTDSLQQWNPNSILPDDASTHLSEDSEHA